MKVSINWAQKYSNVDLKSISTTDLVQGIGEQLGAVEEVINLKDKYKNIYIVKVLKVTKHPDADKLSVCIIDDNQVNKDVKRDKDGYIQVVCGAANVRADIHAVWIPPNAYVPISLSTEPFKISAREIRGEISNGMLASEHELDLSDNHDGILELDSSYQIGQSYVEAFNLDDTIIDLENKMFTHRPDCFGILGVARELAGINHKKFKSPDWYISAKLPILDGFNSSNNIKSEVPRFTVQVIKNITVKDSPEEIQTYLSRVGSRPINNIVDITNYYMQLTGQPTHAFDYDKVKKLSKGETTIFPRMAKNGEELTLLNGKTIKLSDKDIVIATDTKAIALAGVMGGAETEVDENTKNIIIECANFNMYTIRKTSMNHGIFSDAVTRFTKGQSVFQNAIVLNQISTHVIELTGGNLDTSYDSHPKLNAKYLGPINIKTDLVNKLLASDLKAPEMAMLLQNVEFKVGVNENSISVEAPFWRTDIEIAEDIVEEIGRLYGFNKLPASLPPRDSSPAQKNQTLEFKNRLRSILSSAGANEILTYSFVSEKLLTQSDQDPKEAFQLSNALSPELQYYRLTLTPSLLSKVNQNIRAGYDKFAIYELNKTHIKSHSKDSDGLPNELEMLAFVYSENDKKTLPESGAAYYKAKVYLDYIATKLGTKFEYKAITDKVEFQVTKPFDLKRSALVSDKKSGNFIGIIGEFTSSIKKNLKVPTNSAGFEVSYKSLMDIASPLVNYIELPKYPSTSQDITFDVSSSTPFSKLYSTIQKCVTKISDDDGYIFTAETVDIYQKDKSNIKNISLRFTIHHPDKTLTTDEATSIIEKISSYVNKSLSKD